MKTDYEIQAEKFLAETGTTGDIIPNGCSVSKFNKDDPELHDQYLVWFRRNGKEECFSFQDSALNTACRRKTWTVPKKTLAIPLGPHRPVHFLRCLMLPPKNRPRDIQGILC